MSGLFKKPKVPKPEPVQPVPDEQEIEQRRKRNMESRRRRGGTLLSAGDRLG